ncbi:MAG: hypothetical protein HC908_00585 [Calothrix sp. SM1_7_51]|nr:hypothetical protein [Calothrix sp. SM1_7_51]
MAISVPFSWSNSVERDGRRTIGYFTRPIRTAVLKTIKQLEAKAIECNFLQETLQFSSGTYEWVDNWGYKEDAEYASNSVVFELLLERFPQRYPIYQKIVFTILRQVIHQGVSHFKIADYRPTVAALGIAFLDSVALIEKVAQLYGLDVNLPQIDFYFVGELNEYGVINLLRNYQEVNLNATNENKVRFSQKKFFLVMSSLFLLLSC